MKNNVHAQHADQTVKGGLLGLFTYLAMKYSMDPALTALLMPLIAGLLSWAYPVSAIPSWRASLDPSRRTASR